MLSKIKDFFSDILYDIAGRICDYKENASYWNKMITLMCAIAAIGLLIFNIYHFVEEKEANVQAESTVDHVIDPVIEQLNIAKELDSDGSITDLLDLEIDLFNSFKQPLIVLGCIVACVLITYYVSIFKSPFLGMKDIAEVMLKEVEDDGYLYIPAGILMAISVVEIIILFF